MTHRYAYIPILLCLAAFAVGPGQARAQDRNPYSLDQIIRLIESGVFSTDRILVLAGDNCIAFRVDDATERQLLAVGASEALITGLRDVCISLPQVVTYVLVAPAELDVPIGATRIVRAQALGPDSTQMTNVDFEWSVEDTSIANVSAGGTVVGLAMGETRVIASTAAGPEGSALIRVGAGAPVTGEPEDSLVGGKSVGTAAALGIIPGGGEFYVGNTAKGIGIVVGAAAAVAVGALITSEDTTSISFTPTGAPTCTDTTCEYPVRADATIDEKNYIVVGAAVAGALWLYGLIDGIATAKKMPGTPVQDETGQDPGLSLQLMPADGIKIAPSGYTEITFIRIQS
jgi:hypothetical protein